MTKKTLTKVALSVSLDSIIAVYTTVTVIIALTGSFFLQLGPLSLSISHVRKPLLLLLAALALRRIFLGKFFEGFCAHIPVLNSGCKALLEWLKRVERWFTASLWRGVLVLLALGLLYGVTGTFLQSLNFDYGLQGEYFSNTEFEGAPLISARDVSIGEQRIKQELPEIHENYSIRWTGFLYAPRSGTYAFSTASDDGSWLYLDGKLLVDNGGSHGLEERFGKVSLKRGVYPIEIRYVQQKGSSRMKAFWSILNKPKRPLSEDVLFTSIPSGFLLNVRAACRFVRFVLKVLSVVVLVVLVLQRIKPMETAGYSRTLAVLWLFAVSFGIESSLLRRLGLGQLPTSWELLFWCVNVIIILLVLGIRFREFSLKTALQNAVLLGASLALLLGFFEVVLRTGMLDERGTIWIRDKYKQLNDDINAKNWKFANKNPYKFTDIIRGKEKPAGVSRVAVLGDSFVWGASIPYETAWGHKLARRIQAAHQDIEVMNWGYPGWSTADQFNFLSTKGIQYAPDLLLVGFVRNDPDLGNHRWNLFDLRKMSQWYVRAPLWPFRKMVPNVFDFVAAHLNEFLMNYLLRDFGYGWQAWYDKIYSPQNLQRYYLLLKKMADFCEAEGIRLLFVLTPATYGEAEGRKLSEVASLLDRLGIEYLNLYPATLKELGHYPSRQLWGNLGDPHPGDLMTELFANESFSYLEERRILSSPGLK